MSTPPSSGCPAWSRPLRPGIITGSTGAAQLCPLGFPVGIREPLHFYGPILAACFQGWPASASAVMVVACGGPRPLLRELSPVLPRHVRPCGDLQNWAAPPGGVTQSFLNRTLEWVHEAQYITNFDDCLNKSQGEKRLQPI